MAMSMTRVETLWRITEQLEPKLQVVFTPLFFTLAALRQSHAALVQVCEGIGATHEEDCPSDDTCDCKYKPLNDSINTAYRFGASVLSYWEGEKEGLRAKV